MTARTVLVTGASGSLGRAVVEVFDAQGWSVIGHCNREREASSTGQWVRANLGTREGIESLATEVRARTPVLHAFVNCAAIVSFAKIDDVDDGSWETQWSVNVKAPFYLARALRPTLARAEGASVVWVSSTTAVTGAVSVGVEYVSTKGATASMVLTMAKNWAPLDIRVNGVMPGPFESDAVERSPKADELRRRIEGERLPSPTRIAESIEFLASAKSSAVNGTLLNVSGGFMIHL